jgi:hypothetical protein
MPVQVSKFDRVLSYQRLTWREKLLKKKRIILTNEKILRI